MLKELDLFEHDTFDAWLPYRHFLGYIPDTSSQWPLPHVASAANFRIRHGQVE
jgi:hypothetical protein